jgi:hypothetical protein
MPRAGQARSLHKNDRSEADDHIGMEELTSIVDQMMIPFNLRTIVENELERVDSPFLCIALLDTDVLIWIDNGIRILRANKSIQCRVTRTRSIPDTQCTANRLLLKTEQGNSRPSTLYHSHTFPDHSRALSASPRIYRPREASSLTALP